MRRGDLAMLILLDLKGAFDSVPHGRLTRKLRTHSYFSSTAVKFITSYLTGRKQAVVSLEGTSSFLPVLKGVPQGSILAPLLFALYINDFSDLSINANFHLYADDIQLYSRTSHGSIEDGIGVMNECLSLIANWCTENGLRLNPSKTQAMLIGARPPSQEVANSLPRLIVDSTHIDWNQGTVRNLGITLDPSLTWKPHINKLCGKVYGCLRTLYSVSAFLPTKSRVFLVKTLILPLFFYGDIPLFPLQVGLTSQLEKAYNACVRYAFGLRRIDHLTNFRDQILPYPITTHLNLRILNFIWRVKRKALPGYLVDLVQWSHINSTRVVLARRETQFGARSALIEGCSLWNRLPSLVRDTTSLKEFSAGAAEFLLSQ